MRKRSGLKQTIVIIIDSSVFAESKDGHCKLAQAMNAALNKFIFSIKSPIKCLKMVKNGHLQIVL